MFTGNKAMIIRECDRRNEIRRVRNGNVDHLTFFRNIRGDLLISGYVASDMTLISNMVTEYMHRDDMPTIILSAHMDLFEHLRQKLRAGDIDRVMISDPYDRNYHPFYGMTAQKLLHFINMAAEVQGYHPTIDQIMQYASAALNIVAVSYPVSLPALTRLLQNDDDYISSYALQIGLSNVVADIIRANHEAGINLRRICEQLQTIFEDIADEDAETKYNFQSGAQGNVSVMAFYYVSANQKIMNEYLKEELFFTLKRVPRLRVIVDEMEFDSSEDDELFKYLFKMKRQGKIELVFISRNACESAENMHFSFSNVVLSEHDEPAITEELSRALWSTYNYNYPVPVAGKPPALFFTLKTSVHWQIATEERLKVRAEDLYSRQGILGQKSDLLAIKTSANDYIYLVSSDKFMPDHTQLVLTGTGY